MILLGDCNDHLKDIRDNSIDLLVTDPPYGLEFMGKDWDKALVSTETWKECHRVLKQGKLAFVMCSPRQDVLARMIINLQDAGFRTNYSSIYWTYASGFPKAANVSKLIDKRNGAVREVIGIDQIKKAKRAAEVRNGLDSHRKRTQICSPEYRPKSGGGWLHPETVGDITKPATEEAKKMEGAYVGFQPKPAVEVILVVSKGKTISWLDECRIPYQSEDDRYTRDTTLADMRGNNYGRATQTKEIFHIESNEKGRFPANLLCSDDVLNNGKITKSGNFRINEDDELYLGPHEGYHRKNRSNYTHKLKGQIRNFGDEGSYSRYFSLDFWWSKTFPFLIVPKASKSERGEFNHHPTVKALKLMSYLITMGSREGDLVLDPFCGSGTVLIAADQLHRKWIGIERNPEYAEIIKKRLMVPLSQLKLSIY